jgi:phosphoribosylamine--glycine ligase
MLTDRTFGEAGARVVIEEFLAGEEVTIMAFTDGKTVVPMVPAQDHKRVGDGDTGPNTGGMGAYAPAPIADADIRETVRKTVLLPVVEAMSRLGSPFQGALYAGLMIVDGRPYVLEFNARFGDPETQVVLPRLETDLIALLEAAARGQLNDVTIYWSVRSSVGVVLASRGYPSTYATGYPIEGLGRVEPGVLVFHAGTAADPSGYVTAGGRVLTVVGLGDSISDARERVYRNVERIRFQGASYRQDLALRELEAPALP